MTTLQQLMAVAGTHRWTVLDANDPSRKRRSPCRAYLLRHQNREPVLLSFDRSDRLMSATIGEDTLPPQGRKDKVSRYLSSV